MVLDLLDPRVRMGAGIAGLTLRGKDPATGVQTAMAAAGVSRKEWTRVRGIDQRAGSTLVRGDHGRARA